MLQAAAAEACQISPDRISAGSNLTPPRRHSVTIAFLFSLFPGLGAVYNGQNVKALLHFLLIAGSWTLADLFAGTLESLFTLLGIAIYLYSIIDATKSARRANRGGDLALEEEQLRHALQERTDLVGQGLMLLGSMVVINTLAPAFFNRFWPAILIVLGGWVLRWRRRVSSESN